MDTMIESMMTGEFQLKQSVNTKLAELANEIDWNEIVQSDTCKQMLGTVAALKLAGLAYHHN